MPTDFTNNHGGECRKAERQEVFRVWLSAIGWTAMGVFSSSYFFKEAATLAGSRPQQMPKPVINEGKNRSNPP